MSYTISLHAQLQPRQSHPQITTSMCILDGGRYCKPRGAPSSASIVTVWSSGPGHWALRSTIGHAAKLAVGQNHSGTPIFMPYKGQ
jgi:hypothetical protein